MNNVEIRLIPDGRIRIIRLLTDRQKEDLRALRIDGLRMLNINQMEIVQPETWIEYWIDKDEITEDDLRTQINRTLLDSV
jgi:hypothetical protein